MQNNTQPRSLSVIASEIKRNWNETSKNGIYFGAKPYLDAMQTLNTIDENYYEDTAVSVVLYFLANAQTWKGETAKRVKAELNAMVKQQNKKR